jgi:MFS transporter, DHA2 family, metal-tetracycline-proton antiporter
LAPPQQQIDKFDPRQDPEVTNKAAIHALIPLLITFVLGTLCMQAFNLVFQEVGKDIGSVDHASLITAIPGIILGIVCFAYGSLGDFVSLKKMVMTGMVFLLLGSVFGFVATFFFSGNLWVVIVARSVQTAGEQVAGSVYLVIATKYLKPALKVAFFGIYTAAFQLSNVIGILAGGLLTAVHWQYLFLIPILSVVFIPVLMHNLPNKTTKGTKIDLPGFVLFGGGAAFLALFFSFKAWWMLLVAVALFIVLAVYIHKVPNPFITPDFFHNVPWLLGCLLVFVLEFTPNWLSPMMNAIGQSRYAMTPANVSVYLMWGPVLAVVVGCCSGFIVDKIGREVSLVVAGGSMIVGMLMVAFLAQVSPIFFLIAPLFFNAGQAFLYSPLVDTVLGTLNKEQSGRGVGLNDLIMSVTGSIGISLYGNLINWRAFSKGSLIGETGKAAIYSNVALVAAVILALGVCLVIVLSKRLYAGRHDLQQ